MTHESFDLKLFELQRLTALCLVDLLSMNNEDTNHCLETITRRFLGVSFAPAPIWQQGILLVQTNSSGKIH